MEANYPIYWTFFTRLPINIWQLFLPFDLCTALSFSAQEMVCVGGAYTQEIQYLDEMTWEVEKSGFLN